MPPQPLQNNPLLVGPNNIHRVSQAYFRRSPQMEHLQVLALVSKSRKLRRLSNNLIGSNNNISLQVPPSHSLINRNNNWSHKPREEKSNSSSNLGRRGRKDSSKLRVLSWQRASTSRRTSRCTLVPRSANSLSSRERRSPAMLRSNKFLKETSSLSTRSIQLTLISRNSAKSTALRLMLSQNHLPKRALANHKPMN